MIGKHRWIQKIAGLLSLLIASTGMSATYEAAKSAADAALKELYAGDWGGAKERLNRALGECDAGESGRSCRALIRFNLAYSLELWSQAQKDPEKRRDKLGQSAALYEEVLLEAPGHEATVKNLSLVYASLGDTDALVRLLRDQTGVNAARVALLLGKTHGRHGQWKQAFDAYQRAARLQPREDTGLRKMIEAYRHVPDVDHTKALFDSLARWRYRFPDTAERGYRAIIQHGSMPLGSDWERSLLVWVELTAQERRISSTLVTSSLGNVNVAPVQDLAKLLEDPRIGTPEPRGSLSNFLDLNDTKGDVGWWSDSPERRHALAFAALAVGRQEIIKGDPEAVEARWIGGLHLAPPIDQYIGGSLRDQPIVPLDLITELVSLQDRYPKLDSTGDKLQLFIRLLFGGKMQAYMAEDLEAIQRHHTILGRIYARRGPWEDGGFTNARFQLENAVRMAERRRKDENFYMPQPELKRLLAEGYERNEGNSAKARNWYLRAAEASLDTDQLKTADELLDSAERLGPQTRERVLIDALRQILNGRLRIDSLHQADGVDSGRNVPDASEFGWLHADMPPLTGDFIARQRFKAFSDLSALSAQAEQSTVSSDLAAGALAAARRISTLSGTGDLLRVERAVAELRDPDAGYVDLDYFPIETRNTLAWRLDIPSVSVPIFAVVRKSVGESLEKKTR